MGTLSLQGKGLKTFPMEICNFNELRLLENFWEAYDLTKVDLSKNEIESIPEEIANVEVSHFRVESRSNPPRVCTTFIRQSHT